MKVVFAASEGAPFIKTGGLGDVIGSLPHALKKEGVETAVILPFYQDIPLKYKEKLQTVKEISVPLGWRNQYCGLKYLEYKGVPFYFLDNEYYFKRDGIYGFYDEAERFAFFSRALLEMIPFLGFKPDIIHCHDWHTGLVSVFLRAFYQERESYRNLKTVFTIHNLRYQGVFSEFILEDILGLERDGYAEGLQFHDSVNYLKGGIFFADTVTTVSPSYAEEIKDPCYGEGLDDILREKSDKLWGITNGIDYEDYNPLSDQALFRNYRTSLPSKMENKKGLQQELQLPVQEKPPLLAIVSRLVEQKGLSLLFDILDELLELDLQLVILGNGEREYEDRFREMKDRYAEKTSVMFSFNEALARRIYAGSDIFLMPSKFEPCGLSQMIAMRYGSIPIVRETGGLKDTVIPYDPATGHGNGFRFKNYNSRDFLAAIKGALEIYQQKDYWSKLVKNALKSDFSWRKSAGVYVDLFNKVMQRE